MTIIDIPEEPDIEEKPYGPTKKNVSKNSSRKGSKKPAKKDTKKNKPKKESADDEEKKISSTTVIEIDSDEETNQSSFPLIKSSHVNTGALQGTTPVNANGGMDIHIHPSSVPENSDKSIAKAINNLSEPTSETALNMNAYLPPKFAAASSITRQYEDTLYTLSGLDEKRLKKRHWMSQTLNSIKEQSGSRKGFRSKQIENIAKNMVQGDQKKQSAIDKIRRSVVTEKP